MQCWLDILTCPSVLESREPQRVHVQEGKQRLTDNLLLSASQLLLRPVGRSPYPQLKERTGRWGEVKSKTELCWVGQEDYRVG